MEGHDHQWVYASGKSCVYLGLQDGLTAWPGVVAVVDGSSPEMEHAKVEVGYPQYQDLWTSMGAGYQ